MDEKIKKNLSWRMAEPATRKINVDYWNSKLIGGKQILSTFAHLLSKSALRKYKPKLYIIVALEAISKN